MTSKISQPEPAPPALVSNPPGDAARNRPAGRRRINPRMIALAVVGMLIGGLIGAMVFRSGQRAVTDGFARAAEYAQLNLQALGDFEMDQSNAQNDSIPPKWRDLDQKKVALVGQTWNPDAAGHAHNFELCYSIANCCFTGPPKIQHFVFANVAADAAGADIAYGDTVIIKGILHVSVQNDPETGAVLSVYRLDVHHVERVY